MARINLLPWRQEERERKNKEFNVLIAAVAGLAILVVILVYSLLSKDLSNQQDANRKIEDANAQLDVKLKSIEDLESQRADMLSQMKVIQDLQGRRSIPVRVWDDMARAIPDAMYLINIKRTGDLITITGKADNANVVATLVRNLNASEWLDGSAVISITSKIEAYQEVAKQSSDDQKTQLILPEDSYVEFVVTTQVQDLQEDIDQNAQGATDQMEVLPTDGSALVLDESITNPIGVDTDTANVPSASEPATGQTEPAPSNTSVGGQ